MSPFAPTAVSLSVFPFPPTSVFSFSLFSSLSGLPLPLSVSLSSRPLCSGFHTFTSSSPSHLSSVLTSIHSGFCFFLFFLSHSLVLFPARLAADLVTSTPPKPTKARRFLLPFVFCSDSPPNGILGSRWTVSGGAFPQNCDVAEKQNIDLMMGEGAQIWLRNLVMKSEMILQNVKSIISGFY